MNCKKCDRAFQMSVTCGTCQPCEQKASQFWQATAVFSFSFQFQLNSNFELSTKIPGISGIMVVFCLFLAVCLELYIPQRLKYTGVLYKWEPNTCNKTWLMDCSWGTWYPQQHCKFWPSNYSFILMTPILTAWLKKPEYLWQYYFLCIVWTML